MVSSSSYHDDQRMCSYFPTSDLALDAAIRSFSNIAITDFTHQPLQNAIAGVLKTSGIESKYLMNTLRFALTGTKVRSNPNCLPRRQPESAYFSRLGPPFSISYVYWARIKRLGDSKKLVIFRVVESDQITTRFMPHLRGLKTIPTPRINHLIHLARNKNGDSLVDPSSSHLLRPLWVKILAATTSANGH